MIEVIRKVLGHLFNSSNGFRELSERAMHSVLYCEPSLQFFGIGLNIPAQAITHRLCRREQFEQKPVFVHRQSPNQGKEHFIFHGAALLPVHLQTILGAFRGPVAVLPRHESCEIPNWEVIVSACPLQACFGLSGVVAISAAAPYSYRESSHIQFTSQVFPPSGENDCSMRDDFGETFNQT